VSLRSGTGTDQNYLAAWTGDVQVASTTATLTTTWQRFQFTGTVGATATELTLPFTYTPTGTAGANDYYEVTGVQLEVGSVATQFSRAGATIQGELAACQRYYYRLVAGGTYTNLATSGYCSQTNLGILNFQFPVTMRSIPAALETTGTASNYCLLAANGSVIGCTAVTYDSQTNTQIGCFTANTAGSLTVGQGTQFRSNNVTTAYIGWSAEL